MWTQRLDYDMDQIWDNTTQSTAQQHNVREIMVYNPKLPSSQ